MLAYAMGRWIVPSKTLNGTLLARRQYVSQDKSGIVAWVGATTFSTPMGGGGMALDRPYGAAGRLRRFNSCIISPPLLTV